MTTELIIATLVLGVISAAIIALPMLNARRHIFVKNERQITQLEEKLYQMVGAVYDLDFDFDTGKLTPEDYAQQRKVMIGRGVSLVLQLNALRQTVASSDTNDEIEKLVKRYRRQGARS